MTLVLPDECAHKEECPTFKYDDGRIPSHCHFCCAVLPQFKNVEEEKVNKPHKERHVKILGRWYRIDGALACTSSINGLSKSICSDCLHGTMEAPGIGDS